MILRRPRPPDPRLVIGSALALILPLGINVAALAQNVSAQPGTGSARAVQPPAQGVTPSPAASAAAAPPTDPDVLKQRDQELDTLRAAQRDAVENQAKLKREIDAISDDRRAITEQLIETAGRVRDVEAQIDATQARLQALDERERLFRQSLDNRRTVIVEILAALQRIGRQPPPALLVRPEDALQALRTAITLGTVVPEMRAAADALAGDLADLLRVRKEIVAERGHLAQDLGQLAREQLRLSMLIDQRQKRQASVEQALDNDRQRALELANRVGNLKDLIAKLEQNLDSDTRAARLAARAIEADAGSPHLAALGDPGRLAPAMTFATARGHLRLPVNGVRSREFGDPDGAGGTAKGLSITTRAAAQITAPCDGWVVYAGPFRSYGQLLILNAGGGYHVLLAGMERITVDLGQFVLTGEPVAVMGGGSQAAAGGSTGSKQHVLYVEFRKDGAPIDPSPWWATNEGEKVRG